MVAISVTRGAGEGGPRHRLKRVPPGRSGGQAGRPIPRGVERSGGHDHVGGYHGSAPASQLGTLRPAPDERAICGSGSACLGMACGAGNPAHATYFSQSWQSCIICGAAPWAASWAARVPPDPLLARRVNSLTGPTRASAGGPWGRPTIYADVRPWNK